MKKFIVFTQGRTGSTAIVDELNKHPQITCYQELFIKRVNAPKLMEAYKQYGMNFLNYVDNPYRVLPIEFYYRQFRFVKAHSFGLFYRNGKVYTQKRLVSSYLEYIESIHAEVKAMGFKVLVGHGNRWPELYQSMLSRDYSVIYLERRNVVKKTLSGMVAEARGIFNRKNFTPPDERYHINVQEFIRRISIDSAAVIREKEMLRKKGFRVSEVVYEDFLVDRNAFFKSIFDFLGVDHFIPEKSDYTVMINKCASELVSNYGELKGALAKIGMDELLDQ